MKRDPTTTKVVEVLSAVQAADAAAFHEGAGFALHAAGFSVQREVPIYCDGRRGRIDLVLDGWYAIELDRKTPRRKSIRKIKAWGKRGTGMVYCRDAAGFARALVP